MTRDRKRRGLRRGFTTGACATAAAAAAFEALASGVFPDPVTIRLPGGETPSFPLARKALGDGWAEAGVVKDAGDDPDVTHGALILARVERGGPGIAFRAGAGVGTVMRPGLPIPPGEPAINPVPRRMIEDALGGADVVVTLSIPGGAELAKRTLNERLGIVGGLSILGTTGIVVPYSCGAWIAAIRAGVDVARAAGHDHLAACTGRTSERAVRARLNLPETAMIDMGDFAGGLFKVLRKTPVARLTLAGGFAKLAKLAQGETNLHSGASRVDMAWLGGLLADLGGDGSGAETGAGMLAIARRDGLPLGDRVAALARGVAASHLPAHTDVEVLVVDREGEVVGHA
ncbi:MAG: cobalt-precorrin-5B (C(1))-methyltransferase [Magnetospirillum sp. WYHS-4]